MRILPSVVWKVVEVEEKVRLNLVEAHKKTNLPRDSEGAHPKIKSGYYEQVRKANKINAKGKICESMKLKTKQRKQFLSTPF